MWLRQSTASQEVLLGAFLDSTDGDTAETALTIANTDIKLWKEGATTEASKNSGGATHIASGRYYAVLDATDTNTLGKLEINVHVTGALAVRREFMVVPAMVYDSLILGTDTLDTSVTQWLGTAVATPTVAGVPEVDLTHMEGGTQTVTDLKDFADAGYDPATNKVQGVVLVDTTTTNADMVSAAPTANAIADQVWDEILSGHLGAGSTGEALNAAGAAGDPWTTALPGAYGAGSAGKIIGDNINAPIGTVDTVVDAIKVVTDALPDSGALTSVAQASVCTEARLSELDSATSGKMANQVDIIQTDTTTDIPATLTTIEGKVDTVDTNVDSILVDTGTTLPALIDDLAIKKNAAFSNFEFLMVLTSDHVTPATGLTVTGQRSIDGGAFSAVSGSITEVSNGIYQFDALAADTNGNVITWRFSAATADDCFLTFKTVA